MEEEPDDLRLTSVCVVISLQEIVLCPEMSPSFPRKHLLCVCLSSYCLVHEPYRLVNGPGRRHSEAAAVGFLPALTLCLPFSPFLTNFGHHSSPHLLSKGCP